MAADQSFRQRNSLKFAINCCGSGVKSTKGNQFLRRIPFERPDLNLLLARLRIVRNDAPGERVLWSWGKQLNPDCLIVDFICQMGTHTRSSKDSSGGGIHAPSNCFYTVSPAQPFHFTVRLVRAENVLLPMTILMKLPIVFKRYCR